MDVIYEAQPRQVKTSSKEGWSAMLDATCRAGGCIGKSQPPDGLEYPATLQMTADYAWLCQGLPWFLPTGRQRKGSQRGGSATVGKPFSSPTGGDSSGSLGRSAAQLLGW